MGVFIVVVAAAVLVWQLGGIGGDTDVVTPDPSLAPGWELLATSGAPEDFAGGRMVHDSESDRLVWVGSSRADDVAQAWSFDTGTTTWSELSPPPIPLLDVGAAYDAESDRVIVHLQIETPVGGSVVTGEEPVALAYDFNADTWTTMSSAVAPPAGMLHRMVYDSTPGPNT